METWLLTLKQKDNKKLMVDTSLRPSTLEKPNCNKCLRVLESLRHKTGNQAASEDPGWEDDLFYILPHILRRPQRMGACILAPFCILATKKSDPKKPPRVWYRNLPAHTVQPLGVQHKPLGWKSSIMKEEIGCL